MHVGPCKRDVFEVCVPGELFEPLVVEPQKLPPPTLLWDESAVARSSCCRTFDVCYCSRQLDRALAVGGRFRQTRRGPPKFYFGDAKPRKKKNRSGRSLSHRSALSHLFTSFFFVSLTFRCASATSSCRLRAPASRSAVQRTARASSLTSQSRPSSPAFLASRSSCPASSSLACRKNRRGNGQQTCDTAKGSTSLCLGPSLQKLCLRNLPGIYFVFLRWAPR